MKKFGGVAPSQKMYKRQFELLGLFWRWQCGFETLMLGSDGNARAGSGQGQGGGG
jgi:hypothetical protein